MFRRGFSAHSHESCVVLGRRSPYHIIDFDLQFLANLPHLSTTMRYTNLLITAAVVCLCIGKTAGALLKGLRPAFVPCRR